MSVIADARNLIRAQFPRRGDLPPRDDAGFQDDLDFDQMQVRRARRPRSGPRKPKLKPFDFKQIFTIAGGLLMLAGHGTVSFLKGVATDPLRVLPLVGWAVSIYLGFGAVYLCLAIIYYIFTCLGERKPGELSAYSVFNENGERLPGTMTAEDFIGHGLR